MTRIRAAVALALAAGAVMLPLALPQKGLALGPDGTGYQYNCFYLTFNCATNPFCTAPCFSGNNTLVSLYGKPFTNNAVTGTSKTITLYVAGSMVWQGTASTQIFTANTAMYGSGPQKNSVYVFNTGGLVNVNFGGHHNGSWVFG